MASPLFVLIASAGGVRSGAGAAEGARAALELAVALALGATADTLDGVAGTALATDGAAVAAGVSVFCSH